MNGNGFERKCQRMELTFNVSEQKKQLAETQGKQRVKKEVHVPKTTDAYPVVGMTDDHMVVTNLGAPEYSYYIRVVPRDLTYLTAEEYYKLKKSYWDFHKQYSESLKEIFLPLNEENKKQQEYVQYKLNRATDAYAVRELENELMKLKDIEQFYVTFSSFVVIYGSTPEELTDRFKQFLRVGKTLFDTKVMNRQEVSLLLTKINNVGGV